MTEEGGVRCEAWNDVLAHPCIPYTISYWKCPSPLNVVTGKEEALPANMDATEQNVNESNNSSYK